MGQAIAAVKEIGDERARTQALAALTPHLAPEQLGEALAIARMIGDDDARERALAALIPHLAPERVDEAFAAAKANRDRKSSFPGTSRTGFQSLA